MNMKYSYSYFFIYMNEKMNIKCITKISTFATFHEPY